MAAGRHTREEAHLSKFELLDLLNVGEGDSLLLSYWPFVSGDFLIAERLSGSKHPARLPQNHLPRPQLKVALLQGRGGIGTW